LSQAVVFTPPNLSGPEGKAVALLVEEVEKRTQIRWEVSTVWPTATNPVIALGPSSTLNALAEKDAPPFRPGPNSPEGFQIYTGPEAHTVFVIGQDARGVLFGAGQLLRSLRLRLGSVTLPDDFKRVTAPKYALRGHQLGYRPKTHSYDAWDLPIWEQY